MHNLIIAGMTLLMAYAFFTMDEEDLETVKIKTKTQAETEFKGRKRIFSCTSCRKQKWHWEIEHDLWECRKCKRKIDLRVS